MADAASPPLMSRESLLHALYEAAELEHNLMCTYLYAAFSLKDGEADGLSPEEAAALARWRSTIVHVATRCGQDWANPHSRGLLNRLLVWRLRLKGPSPATTLPPSPAHMRKMGGWLTPRSSRQSQRLERAKM